MSCFDVQKKLKDNITLTEKEKEHIKECDDCQNVMDDVLEEELKTTGNRIKKATETKSIRIKTEDIMENIRNRVGKKIKFFNDKLLIMIVSFVLVFSLAAYFYSYSSKQMTQNEVSKAKTVEVKDRSGDLTIKPYYDDVKAQQGYSIITEKKASCNVKGRYLAHIGELSNIRVSFSSINLKDGLLNMSVEDSSEFVRVNCDDLFFFNIKNGKIILMRNKEEATLSVEQGVVECYINNRFVLLGAGEKLIIGNDRRFKRVDI